ncbi:hypothetical protein [Leekyejoonella antrihumi]|uniref:Uncharacterized protein n=1 Tax=Leekyejoonella antrihumi TaxID=1660198 RepID=A0A563DTR3_9MICO|nr:hypothetical protein [Leekyejoonella antrihumi]TWP33566.1 hypothetical protein FGL98_20725 [Leekyejoonella antrihumi]
MAGNQHGAVNPRVCADRDQAQAVDQGRGSLFVFQVALLMVVAIALLVEHSSHINLAPFDPDHLDRGLSGLSLGFPLAVYLFVGWENSAARRLGSVHHGCRWGRRRADVRRVAGGLYLDLLLPDRRGQLAGENHLPLRPRRAAPADLRAADTHDDRDRTIGERVGSIVADAD